jgi:hypothetical protein
MIPSVYFTRRSFRTHEMCRSAISCAQASRGKNVHITTLLQKIPDMQYVKQKLVKNARI